MKELLASTTPLPFGSSMIGLSVFEEEMVLPSILMLSISILPTPVTMPPVVEKVPSVSVPPAIVAVVVTSWLPKSGSIFVPSMAALPLTSLLTMVRFSMSSEVTSLSSILSDVTASAASSLFLTPAALILTMSVLVSSVMLSTLTSSSPEFSTSPSPSMSPSSRTKVSP